MRAESTFGSAGMKSRNNLPNSGRQPELDAARGLAVLFMIAVHVLETLGTHSILESGLGFTIGFLGGPPAAPVFMALLGAGIVYSRTATPARLARRGVLLIGLGYLLNVLRGAAPTLIGFWSAPDSVSLSSVMLQVAAVDIFHFAGLAFLFFAAWKSIGADDRWLLIVPAAAIGVHAVLQSEMVLDPTAPLLLQAATGLVWGSSPVSYFPFLTWISYPILGYLLGRLLIRTTNKRWLYLFASGVGLGMLVLGFVFGSIVFDVDVGFENEYAYYHHGLVGTIVISGFVLFWFGLVYACRFLVNGVIGTTLKRWSSNVAVIYFVHWIILGWSALILGENSNGVGVLVAYLVALIAVSDLVASIWFRHVGRLGDQRRP